MWQKGEESGTGPGPATSQTHQPFGTWQHGRGGANAERCLDRVELHHTDSGEYNHVIKMLLPRCGLMDDIMVQAQLAHTLLTYRVPD